MAALPEQVDTVGVEKCTRQYPINTVPLTDSEDEAWTGHDGRETAT